MATEYQGTCYCGTVIVTVRGEPAGAGLCHCESCRKWHVAPVNAWAIWPEDAVTIAGGDVLTSSKSDGSQRVSCSACGGGIANRKPGMKMVVTYPSVLSGSDFRFEASCHIFYGERVMDFADGLPKFRDMPKHFGGSGEAIEEPAATRWIG